MKVANCPEHVVAKTLAKWSLVGGGGSRHWLAELGRRRQEGGGRMETTVSQTSQTSQASFRFSAFALGFSG